MLRRYKKVKKGTKIFLRFLCLAVCVVLAVSMAPVSRAAGMMRLVIDQHTYSKVYNDMGSLALTHWNYDYSEDTLTLENFGTANSPQTPIFAYPYSGNMTVELRGNNYIKASREMAMIIIGHLTFTGSGTLTVIAADTYGIYTDYSVTIKDGASLNINALAGITGMKGFNIDTTGSINIHTTGKCLYAYEDIKVTQGTLNLSGSNGFYTAYGNVFISGGNTDVLIDSTSRAIYTPGENAYIEWSANGVIYAGESSPGAPVTSYNNEKYFRASFYGIPKLNPPREVYWDETVIDSAGTTNPVGRWSPVENASGYMVYLYHYNDIGYTLTKTFTVTDALSCNFGGHFTTYGKYAFAVKALGDEVNYTSSENSARTTGFYYFTGETESRFYVTLPESDYFKVIPENGSTVVYYGEDFSFTVEVDPAYTQSEILVWANDVRVALRHGKYTVNNVTENLTIRIGDMNVNTYTVTLPEHEAFTIYPLPEYSTQVEYGGSFAFSVELSDIYLNSNIVVTANGTKLSAKYGIIYTISNITEDYTVEISGLVRDNYEVVYQHLDGTQILTQTVDHGDKTTAPAAPSLADGLEFVGWTLKDGSLFDFSTPINEKVTLYARFEPEKQDGYYLISTLEQLVWFRDEVNFGNTAINAKLCADIPMNEGNYILMSGIPNFTEDAVMWKPIGGYDYSDNENYVKFYEGHFDGCGYTLSGFYIVHDKMAPEASELGIFGATSEDSVISNLNVTLSSFDGYGNIGGIVGTNYGLVENCTSSAVLYGVEDVGGITGEANNSVTGCTFTGTVKVEEYSSSSSVAAIGGHNAGGIVGNLYAANATVSDCENTGSITAKQNAGGIVGYVSDSGCIIENCTNAAAVYAQENSAGILGRNAGAATTVKSCSNSGEITALAGAGGIFGNASVVVEGCENSGRVDGGLYAGGFGALGNLTVSYSINKGEVVSSDGIAAGFMAADNVTATYCYNIGPVSGGTYAGGICGAAANASIESCHNYASVTAQTADGICADFAQGEIERSYSLSSLAPTVNGTSATQEMFYTGYVAIFLNGEDETPIWAQGEKYPVFADETNKAYVFPFDGDGTKLDPYIISTENELRIASAYVNNISGWSAKHYKLGADISLSNPETANNFVAFASLSNYFSGSFDGDGHTISGFNFSVDENNAALFRVVAAGGEINNLNVRGFNISGRNNSAALVGTNRGTVNNCTVSESVINGVDNCGAAVGYNLGTISFVTTDAEVCGSMSVGGVAGLHESGKLVYCFNYGSIHGLENAESYEIGGIAGKSFAVINYCGNLGDVSATEYAGGIVGIAYTEIRSLFNGGKVTAEAFSDAIAGGYELEDLPELCFYLEGTSSGETGIGASQTQQELYAGLTAYALNNNGTEKNWAQGDGYPTFALPDGSNAVVHTVTYYSFDELYYRSAVMHSGSAIRPADPESGEYNFLYWDVDLDCVTQDVVTRAVFDRTYYITYTPTSNLEYFDGDYISVICGIEPEQGMTVKELRSQIANQNITIMDNDMLYYSDEDETVYTGMTVALYTDREGNYVHVANVVIFGDISGDGKVNDTDAFLLNMVLTEMVYLDELNFAQQVAADLNRDGIIDEADAELLQSYCLRDYDISQSATVI